MAMSTFSIVTGGRRAVRSAHGRIHLGPSLPRLELGMIHKFLHGVHPRVRDLRRFEPGDDFGSGQVLEYFVHGLIELRAILDPLGIRVKTRIGSKLGRTEVRLHKTFSIRVRSAGRDRPFSCLPLLPGRMERSWRGLRRCAEEPIPRSDIVGGVTHPFRRANRRERFPGQLPSPVCDSDEQCGQNSGIGVHAAGNIGNGNADFGRAFPRCR